MKKEEITKTVINAKSGDQKAFSVLFDYFYSKIYRISFSFLGIHEDAEDATMEILTKAFLKIEKYEQDISFEFWLKRIATNHLIDKFRQNKGGALFVNEINENDAVDAMSPELKLIGEENSLILKKKINDLPEKEKKAILMRIDGKKYSQIARKMNLNMSSIKSCIYRAKKSL